ncbi:MAG: ATP-binding cassette domain-containing protein [Chloroflexi bacterium]|nr:ATP-binding cassette domain-containing protein [Chloroflexota bacterium]
MSLVTPTPAAPDMAIVTRGLTKRYGSRLAVQDLDLNVPRGQVYGFLGPNGSGKTTTLRMLVGLIRPNAGDIQVLGQPWSWRDRRRMSRIGAMIETPAFYPYLTGRDNLRVFAATGAPTPASRVEEVLQAVGLADRARDKVRTYSLGMRQRLGIAVALLSDPDLLLLDEPANGLDPAGIVAMREMLRYLTDRGKTVLVSSHILPEVQQLADIVGIIDRGRLVREGPMAALLAGGAQVRVLVRPDEMQRAVGALGQLGAAVEPAPPDGPHAGWITVRVPSDQASTCNRLLAEQGIFASAIDATSDLESVFLSLTAGAGMDMDMDSATTGPPTGWGESETRR